MRWFGISSLALLLATLLAAQPPRIEPPDKETRQTIEARTEQLASAVDKLRRAGVRDPFLADVEVYLRAAQMIVQHEEFYRQSARWTVAVLDRGLLRASQQSRGESPWLAQTGQTVARAYRSRIDGSVQPFAVTYPHDYGQDRRKRYRIDVVLHGRDSGLTEVSFLYRHRGESAAAKDLSYVRIDVFGRGNNAYRWAGETDVWEAVENFLAVEALTGRVGFLDTNRVVLRGFSMGGAGAWHIGLHRPDQFCVVGPGAGFNVTRGYVARLPDKLPPYQEACLHIYDAADYAENAFNVPVVAFSGEEDKQIAAARNVEARLKGTNIAITHLVAPKTGHRVPPEWEKKLQTLYARHAAKGRPEHPEHVHFVTYTLKYPSCHWVELLSLEQHYQKSLVDARRVKGGLEVKTSNVRAVRLGLWPGAVREPIPVTIDGQQLEGVRPYQARTADLHLYLEKRDGKWASVLPERLFVDRLRRPRKGGGLQGPIDDAFMAPFLCVRGTGKPWHEATQAYARANLERFRREWSKYLRGELPIKDDSEVTAEDIATRHLVLFGDPSSNSLIAQALPRLPLKWDRKVINWGPKVYDAQKHVPVLIYPSPLASDRYLVLNSGHTFRGRDFEGTNALLYPRLGDHAVLKLVPESKDPLAVEVAAAGLFDDDWRVADR